MSDNRLSRCWRGCYQSICSNVQRCCCCCCCCCCCTCRRRGPNTLERTLIQKCAAVNSYGVFNLLTLLPCVYVNCQDPASGDTPLLLATEADNYRKVQTLLRRGADSQRPNRVGLTPLRLALTRRQHDMVHLMCCVHHTDVDAYRQRGRGGSDTALHQACLEDNHPGLSTLLSSGANPDLLFVDVTPRGCHLSCLDIAVMRRNGVIVKELLSYNCRPLLQTLCSCTRTVHSERVWKVLETSPVIVGMLVQAGCPLGKYWWLQQRPRLPADSFLKAKILEVPSLKTRCRTVVREVLNKRQEWRKGYHVRQQVMKVLGYYRWRGVSFGRSVFHVRDFLSLSKLELSASVGSAVNVERQRGQQIL